MTRLRYAIMVVRRRWRRNLLTVLAMAVGTAAVASMLGISQASAQRVVERVSAFEASSITFSLPSESWSLDEGVLQERAAQLPGASQMGTLVLPDSGTRSLELGTIRSGVRATAGVAIASKQGLVARGATVVAGGFPAESVAERDPYAIVLGVAIAKELGVSAEAGNNLILVDGRKATVVGVVRDGGNNSILSTAVVLPLASAAYLDMLPPSRFFTLQVDPGALSTVAAQIPLAMYAEDPSSVTLKVPPSPGELRSQLLADSQALILVVTLVMIAATSLSIVTTMQIAVWERRREIGLVRALGQTSRDVALGFMWEAIVLGGVGAVVGWTAGVIISAVVSTLNGWTFVLPVEILGVPALGLVVGAIAGLLPALSASRVDPADLLRAS